MNVFMVWATLGREGAEGEQLAVGVDEAGLHRRGRPEVGRVRHHAVGSLGGAGRGAGDRHLPLRAGAATGDQHRRAGGGQAAELEEPAPRQWAGQEPEALGGFGGVVAGS